MGLKSFMRSPRQWIREKTAQAVRNNSYGWSWFYIRILRVNPIEAVKEICEATNAAVAWIVLGVKKMFSGPQSGFKIDMETTTRAISKMLEKPEVNNFAIRLKEIVECVPLSIYERPEFEQIWCDLARSFDDDRIEAVLEEAKKLPEGENVNDRSNAVQDIFNGILAATIGDSEVKQSCDFMRVPGLMDYLLDKNLMTRETLSASIERADADQLYRAIVAAVGNDIGAIKLIADDLERLSQSHEPGNRDKFVAVLHSVYEKYRNTPYLMANILHNFAGGFFCPVREGILQYIKSFFAEELNKVPLNENTLAVLRELACKIEFGVDLNKLALDKFIKNRQEKLPYPMIKELLQKEPEYVLSYASALCDNKEFSYAKDLFEYAVYVLQVSNIVKNGNLLKLEHDILTKIANKCPETIYTLYDVKYCSSLSPVLLLLENENVMSSEEYRTLITEPMKHHRDSVLRLFSLVSFGSDIAKTHPRFANMAADFAFTKGNVTKELRSNAISYFINQYNISDFAKTFVDKALENDSADLEKIYEVLTELPACYTFKDELIARLSKRYSPGNKEERSVAPTVAPTAQGIQQPGP